MVQNTIIPALWSFFNPPRGGWRSFAWWVPHGGLGFVEDTPSMPDFVRKPTRPSSSDPTARWRDRVWQEFHADNLTRAYRDVLLTLRTFRGHGGVIIPAHATLAERVECCVRTVQRALAQGALLGLVSWTERRVRHGWRWLRTSNNYTLTIPDEPVQLGLRRARPCRSSTTGQQGRGGERLKKTKAWEGRGDPAAARAFLAAIAAERQQQRDAAWVARRSPPHARSG